MNGLFLDHHAIINISFRVQENDAFQTIDIEFIIDTGFSGYLALPVAAVQALELPAVRVATAHLADGSEKQVDVYEAEIFWHGILRKADVFAMGDVPLLGTLLLEGCELNIRFADHEDVTVSPL